MKKTISLSLVLIIVLSLVGCQSKINSHFNQLTTNQNKSKDKYVTKEVLDKVKIKEHALGISGVKNYYYDDYGRLIKVTSNFGNGTEVISRYKYDDKGRKIYSYKSCNEDCLAEETKYKYNEKGKLIKKVTKTEDDFIRRQKFEYNQAGKKVKEIDKRKQDGEFIAKFREKRKYNKNNKLVEVKLFRNSELIKTEKYAYDEKGNKILEKKTGIDPMTEEEYCEWYEWEYDDKGRVLKEIKKDKTGKIIEGKVNKYNEKGQKIKKTFLNKGGNIERQYINVYDENNKRKKLIVKDSTGEIVSKTYFIYDKNGNKIKYVTRNNNGEITDKAEYEYNSGKLTKEIWIDIKNDKEIVDQIRKYKYDEYNNKILEVHKNRKGVILEKTEKDFFKKDKLKYYKKIKRNKDGDLRVKKEEHFDKRGNSVRYIETKADGSKRMNYERDYIYKKIKVKKGGKNNE